MDSKTAWDQFNRSGSVCAYLNYKCIEREEKQETQHVYQAKRGCPSQNAYLG